jgi:valyl-tRNA synthetase
MQKFYDPKGIEKRWYTYWEEEALFNAEVQRKRKPYTILIPPPNVTGILTVGHVLNTALQDIVIRWKRMQGYEALWLPGCDHAGIATQNVVEEHLAKEGKTRFDLGREKFVKRVWEWKKLYEERIISQLKALGSSCDWRRKRFTLDKGLSKAVQLVFCRLYEKGLIYRGNYIINYCPRCKTAISNDEVEHIDTKGKLYYIKYPIEGKKGFLIVATTRPETMLGDTALAYHPSDKRFKSYRNKRAIIPIMGRKIKIIEDDFVDPKFGTGLVKVTPAHDANDFEISKRHDLDIVYVIDDEGKMTEEAGKYKGLDRFEARKTLIEDLKEMGLLEKVTEHDHAIGRCYRCDTVIEPFLSTQWFVKMKPLADMAIDVVKKGDIAFHLPRWKKVYFHWLENVRDWCISRQLWWGHRIPVWYCTKCKGFIVNVEKPKKCAKCGGSDFEQDEDVLDTWFSSWLWPFSTLGWPEKTEELDYFFPTDTLITGWDIIFLWVARMIMASLEFTGTIPFKDVYFNGMVRDEQRRKLSKSLGNSPDPMDLIDQYGADAVRIGLLFITPEGQDVLFSTERIEVGRNFANKIWNASRFILSTIEKQGIQLKDEPVIPKTKEGIWILSRIQSLIDEITSFMKHFRFNDVARTLYEFFWHEYCDWYLEMIKPLINKGTKRDIENVCATMVYAMKIQMKLLHPFMPFITEEIYQRLPHSAKSIMISPWPIHDKARIDREVEKEIERLKQVITALRNIRGEMGVKPKCKVSCIITSISEKSLAWLKGYERYIKELGKVDTLTVVAKAEKPPFSASWVVEDMELYVPLKDIIDINVEKERLTKEITKLEKESHGLEMKLTNPKFLKKAPKEVVELTEKKKGDFGSKIERLQKNLKTLLETTPNGEEKQEKTN